MAAPCLTKVVFKLIICVCVRCFSFASIQPRAKKRSSTRHCMNVVGSITTCWKNAKKLISKRAKACLAKSITDASWSAFFAQLSAKAEEAGRTLIKVNPAYTSQTCSVCGHRQQMPLSERVFDCPCCHVHLDRDLNAARNICALGLQSLGLSVEAPWL